MDLETTKQFVLDMREAGAIRVKVAEVEVSFPHSIEDEMSLSDYLSAPDAKTPTETDEQADKRLERLLYSHAE